MHRYNRSSCPGTVLAVAWLLVHSVCADTRASQSPDFSQAAIASAAQESNEAWRNWDTSDRNLESQVFGLPMAVARDRIESAFSRILTYVEKRRLYNQAVLDYITARAARVSTAVVSADDNEQLGLSLMALGARLEALRSTPEWIDIRQAVVPDRSRILSLEDARRDDIRVSPGLESSRPANGMSVVAYVDSEEQLRDALKKLWTDYYQSLADAVERPLGRSTPLSPTAEVRRQETLSATGQIAMPRGADSPLAGIWVYKEGSQQFNGVAEPHQVILELWMEHGILVGRYRAELSDFDQLRTIDLTLRGKPGAGRTQTLEFRSRQPEASGAIVLEGPGATGVDVMLVRTVGNNAPIPRGRERLTRY